MDYVSKTVQDKDPSINLERVRAVMGALGLTGSKATQRIGTMSGGEKARVALSMFVLIPHNCLILDEPSNHLDVGTVEGVGGGVFVLIPHNCLILDEPSNHLDVGTVEVLTEALQEYKGTVVVVTHNREFLELLAPTHIASYKGTVVVVVVTHNREFLELLAPTHIASVGGAPGSQKVTVEERPLRPSDWEGLPEEAGMQKVTVEERPLRPADWEGLPEEEGGGVPGARKATITLGRSGEGGGVPGARKATITLGRSGGGAGVKKMGGGRQATAKPAKDEEPAEREKYAWEADDALDTGMSINAKGQKEPEREKYAWEADDALDTGMSRNAKGQLVSKDNKNMAPQQKKKTIHCRYNAHLVSKDNKKMTPQQKKKEKQQGKGGMFSSTTLDRSEESGDGKKAVMYRKGDKKPKSNKQGKK
ncbi:hypothetical protein T484DRAFT_1769877 [Baffinella frigidus]|nr:hypothetical protein T484DRAFT_1769877 [Cryptophyta sp. CCMP2293]